MTNLPSVPARERCSRKGHSKYRFVHLESWKSLHHIDISERVSDTNFGKSSYDEQVASDTILNIIPTEVSQSPSSCRASA